jgi:hypothetical protein
LTWGPKYPVVDLPEISLDLFYNKHLVASVKDAIKKVEIAQQTKNKENMRTLNKTLFYSSNISNVIY